MRRTCYLIAAVVIIGVLCYDLIVMQRSRELHRAVQEMLARP